MNKNDASRQTDININSRLKNKKLRGEKKGIETKIERKPFTHLVERTWGIKCIEEEWQELQNNLWKTSKKVFGFETRIHKREWFDADCETDTGRSIEAYKSWLRRPTRARRTRYEELRK
jgi:hypothetical protein